MAESDKGNVLPAHTPIYCF